MEILILTAVVLCVILLIKYCNRSKQSCALRILVIFGFSLGFLIIVLHDLVMGGFGASTPVQPRVENLTDKTLKIYAIKFWMNESSMKESFVYYGTKLKPYETSDFQFENEGGIEFWLVAKNNEDNIEYLEVVKKSEYKREFKITANQLIDPTKAQYAKDYTLTKDKDYQKRQFALGAIMVLMGLLILSLFRFKRTAGNN